MTFADLKIILFRSRLETHFLLISFLGRWAGGECRGRTRHFPECDRDNPHFQISGFFQLNSCGNETDEILLLLILVLLLLIDSSFPSNRAPAKVGSGDENFVRKKMIEKMESNLILRYKACLETLLVQQSHAHTVGQKEAKSFF